MVGTPVTTEGLVSFRGRWLTVPNGHFVASSTGNGDGDGNADGDIDTAGRAWGMFANSGPLAAAFGGSVRH